MTTTKENYFPRSAYISKGAIAPLRGIAELCARQRKVRDFSAGGFAERGAHASEIARIYRNELCAANPFGGAPEIRPEFKAAALEAATDADTLGTLTGTLVAQRALELFRYDLPLVNRVANDFSDAPAFLNQTISTRRVNVPAVQTYDPTLDANGYPNGWKTASAASTTDVNVTLDEMVGVPIPIDAATLASTARRLFDEAAPAASYALTKYFVDKIYALCTTANFNAYAVQGAKVPTAYATYPVAVVDWARSKISDIEAAFDMNEVPSRDRSILLNPLYYAKLANDPAIVTFFAGQQHPEIITDSMLPPLCGFTPLKAANFPTDNNRVGFAFNRNALVAVTRLSNDYSNVLPGASYGSVSQVTDDQTGISVALVQYVDHNRGMAVWRMEVILGAAKGDVRGGLVITSQ